MKQQKKYRKIEKQNSAKNSGESANNFLYNFTWRKTQFSRNAQKAEKTPLFSRVLAFFVSRETDAENQIVPRET